MKSIHPCTIGIAAILSVMLCGCSEKLAPPPLKQFRMPVEDVFYIKEKGVLATGTIDSGTVVPGNKLELVRTDGSKRVVQVVGIERFGEALESASTGEKVGIQLADLEKKDLSREDILQSVSPADLQ